MNGIMSSSPAASGIRLLVGSHLLLLVQAGLVLRSAAPLGPMLTAITVLTAIAAFAALVTAIVGEPRERSDHRRSCPSRRPSHG